MENLDAVRINFNAEQLRLLNICLGFIMFGVALDLKLAQFGALFRSPKSVLVGMSSQLVLLPLVTLGLIWILHPPFGLALGMLLVASCPGGNVSNYATHLSGSNTVLSVSMTTLSTLGAAFTTPFIFTRLQPFIQGEEAVSGALSVNPWAMVWSIVQLILIPLALGFFFQRYLPGLTARLLRPVQRLSMLIFLGFLAVAIVGNLANIGKYLPYIFFYVLVHNGLALATGYFWGRLYRLPEADVRAVSIETGIQNSGLALVLIFNFFDGRGGMALIAAWWGVWHMVSAFGLALIWKRFP
ncbi:MAG: bile acid:sodium symporter family protein [Haliscomenobacter sp.]